MTVQRWVMAPAVDNVGVVRRGVVAFAAEHGVAGITLADLAIAVSEILSNVARHGGSAADVTITADVRDDEVSVVVRGAGVGLSPRVNGAPVGAGLVLVAALAHDLRVGTAEGGGQEVAMTLRRTAAPPSARRPPNPPRASL